MNNEETINRVLSEHPELEFVDLQIADMHGIFRGKRVSVAKLPKIFSEGAFMPTSVFGLSVTGQTIERTGLGFASGDGDSRCQLIPESFSVVPWHPGLAQVQLRMEGDSGGWYYGDPRTVLESVVRRFQERKITPVVAIEMEFYLIDKLLTRQGLPQPPRSPRTGVREKESQLYSFRALDTYGAFLKEVQRAAHDLGIPADTAVAELDAGQFEVNLQHVTDPVLACGQALMLKHIIRNVALRHDMEATFMPKPYQDLAGNGMHVHLSLLDEHGKNLFQGEDVYGSKTLKHAIAGILDLMRESMLICAPHANSYQRFKPGSFAPCNRTWGWNNRTTALRIPAGLPESTRIEHRLAGAGANPFLLVAILLVGLEHGINKELEPPPPVMGDAYSLGPDLPRSWEQATLAFENAQVLPEALGRDFWRLFSNFKRGEQELFQEFFHPLEYDWYLKTL